MARIDTKALGLTLGIIWGASVLIMALLAKFCNYGTGLIAALSTMYIGTEATFRGGTIGAIWAFCDAGVFGLAIGWLYNKISK